MTALSSSPSKSLPRCALLLALTGVLAACSDGSLSVNLAADRPADTGINQLVVKPTAVTLVADDGTEERIEIDNPAAIDLMRYETSGAPLIQSTRVDSATYTQVKLELATSGNDTNYLVLSNNGRVPLTITANDAIVPLNLKVKKQGRSYTVDLRLDLQLSLSNDADNNNGRRLKPVLRAARDSKAATIGGSVANGRISDCGSSSAATGISVYAFKGSDITPNDMSPGEPQPVASARVSGSSGNYAYTLRTLAAGDYTLALTCNANRDNPETDDDNDQNGVRFLTPARNVPVDEGETQDRDF